MHIKLVHSEVISSQHIIIKIIIVGEAVRWSTAFDLRNFTISEELYFEESSLCITACHSYKLKRSDDSAALTGFNRQPSVQSMGQFHFLWRSKTSSECKERVLQRLADREVKGLLPGRVSNKYSPKEWDGMVEAALSAGKSDYCIYDLVRRVVLGSSLEDDLRTGRRAVAFSTPAAADSSDGDGNGRASIMVKMALDCIPSTTCLRLKKGDRYMLDYGCAEGSITSSLGQALGMKPEFILGADVRAIPSEGFTFLQLPAEDPLRPPSPRSILPSLRDHTVEFVTASMVFHHVTHIEAVLQELRRVIANDGLLLLREHHCSSPEMAAFLDITHGLYSLSWSRPVEWPDFVDEYKAFYRSQKEWDALLLQAGFKLSLLLEGSKASASYEAVQVPNKRKANGSYPNVIKAYYAVYEPVPVEITAVAHAQLSKRPIEDAFDEADNGSGVLKRRSCVGVATGKLTKPDDNLLLGLTAESSPGELFESKKYPGRFYRVNKVTGATEWIP